MSKNDIARNQVFSQVKIFLSCEVEIGSIGFNGLVMKNCWLVRNVEERSISFSFR
jgi:hypothetical protein